jgi:hypothetical protein
MKTRNFADALERDEVADFLLGRPAYKIWDGLCDRKFVPQDFLTGMKLITLLWQLNHDPKIPLSFEKGVLDIVDNEDLALGLYCAAKWLRIFVSFENSKIIKEDDFYKDIFEIDVDYIFVRIQNSFEFNLHHLQLDTRDELIRDTELENVADVIARIIDRTQSMIAENKALS